MRIDPIGIHSAQPAPYGGHMPQQGDIDASALRAIWFEGEDAGVTRALLAPLLPGMEEPPHPQRLGADEKDYFLGLPPTGVPDTRTGPVNTEEVAS